MRSDTDFNLYSLDENFWLWYITAGFIFLVFC